MTKPNDKYALIRPCARCPFRNDITPYLREWRIYDIEASLVQGEFYCHETTYLDNQVDENGEYLEYYVPQGSEIVCAGSLILLEKLERPSQMMRISERLGLYDMRKLDMAAPVWGSFKQMADAQPVRS